MSNSNKRTSWIIGTTNLCIAFTNLFAAIISGKLIFWILSLLYAFLAPVFVVEPRKELIGPFACLLHCFTAFGFASIYIFLIGIEVIVVNIAVSFLCVVFFNVLNRVSLFSFRGTWPPGIIYISNTTIALLAYYALLCLVFGITIVFCNCTHLFVQIILLSSSILLSFCFFYYKNWYIQISGDNILLYHKQLKRRLSIESLKVKKLGDIFFLGDKFNHFPICICLQMTGFSSIWPIIRNRL